MEKKDGRPFTLEDTLKLLEGATDNAMKALQAAAAAGLTAEAAVSSAEKAFVAVKAEAVEDAVVVVKAEAVEDAFVAAKAETVEGVGRSKSTDLSESEASRTSTTDPDGPQRSLASETREAACAEDTVCEDALEPLIHAMVRRALDRALAELMAATTESASGGAAPTKVAISPSDSTARLRPPAVKVLPEVKLERVPAAHQAAAQQAGRPTRPAAKAAARWRIGLLLLCYALLLSVHLNLQPRWGHLAAMWPTVPRPPAPPAVRPRRAALRRRFGGFVAATRGAIMRLVRAGAQLA